MQAGPVFGPPSLDDVINECEDVRVSLLEDARKARNARNRKKRREESEDARKAGADALVMLHTDSLIPHPSVRASQHRRRVMNDLLEALERGERVVVLRGAIPLRSEEHTSDLQSLIRIS